MEDSHASPKPRSVFFDMDVESADGAIAPLDPDPTGASRTAAGTEYFAGRGTRRVMVSNPETDGMSLSILEFAPGTVLPRHRHNVGYIEFVLKGEVRHGNRVLKAGEGVYRGADSWYTFTVGPQGATIADFRANTFYTTEYADAPERWPAHAIPLAEDNSASAPN